METEIVMAVIKLGFNIATRLIEDRAESPMEMMTKEEIMRHIDELSVRTVADLMSEGMNKGPRR